MIKDLYRFYNKDIYPHVQKYRGATRLRILLENLAFRKITKVSKDDGLNIFEEDWDNLIIIDACRQDFWEEETGMEGSRVSRASATAEYIEKNFSEGDFSDYVYVSANPQFSDWKFEKLTGRLPEDVFCSVFKTFNSDWDSEANTVLPEDTIRDALTAQRLFPDKKIVVHFLPPHYPFVRQPVSGEGINSEMAGEGKSAWELAEEGVISHEDVEEAYRDNINYIEPYVDELNEKLEGDTSLTSDHGNLVGEEGFYGHPRDRRERALRVVPYKEL